MDLLSSECVILKRQDFKESELLVTFLTRDRGRLTGIVKGSKKITGRGVGSFEPFQLGVMHYSESPRSELVTIRKCDPRPPYLFLKLDYRKLLYAGYLAELALICPIPAQESEGFYQLLARGLARLGEAESPAHLELARLGYELEFLERLGLAPGFARCVECRAAIFSAGAPGRGGRLQAAVAEEHQFDLAQGGVRCPHCRRGGREVLPLSPGTLNFLAATFLTMPPSGPPSGAANVVATVQPTRLALQELQHAITQHLIRHLEREPRSLKLLHDLPEG